MKGLHRLALPLAGIAIVSMAACGRGKSEISYAEDIQPILNAKCQYCHLAGTAGYEASQFGMATYEEVMQGTRYGPMVIPGDADSSVLVMLIEGRADPAINMPHGEAQPLYKGEIEKIRLWVEQGAKNN